MPIANVLKCSGLQTYKNRISELDAGALVKANNVVIDRDSVIESRRGFKLYGTAMASASKQLLVYKDRILRHYGNILQVDDGNGTFSTFEITRTGNTNSNTTISNLSSTSDLFVGMSVSGTGVPTSATITKILSTTSVQISSSATSSTVGTSLVFKYNITEASSDIRIKYVEVNGNLYFTSSKGIKKISAANAAGISSITDAGMAKGLDLTATLNSTEGFFTQDSVVGYRVVWGITDSNNNVVLGSPSQRAVLSNPIEGLLKTDFSSLLTKLDTQNQKTFTFTLSGSATVTTGDVYTHNSGTFVIAKDTTSTVLIATSTTAPTASGTLTKLSGSGPATISFTSVSSLSSGINDANYVSTLNSYSTLSASSLKTGLTQLCTKIDNDVVLPSISTYSYSSPTLTITFSSDVTALLKSGDSLKITGTNHNGIYLISTVSGSTVTIKTINTSTVVAETAKRLKYTVGYFRTNSTTTIPLTIAGLELVSNYLYLRFNSDISSYVFPNDSITISGLSGTYSELNGTFSVNAVLKRTSSTYDTIQINYIRATNFTPEVTTTDVVNSRVVVNSSSNTLTLSTNPTSTQLLNLQSYYSQIVTTLQNELTGIVKPSDFDANVAKTSSTVSLTFSIPQSITTNHFYQIYRTYLSTSSGVNILSDFDPGDEQKLAYEGNPTYLDITNGFITLTDVTLESFLGANLYTNSVSGEGILQANDTPPFSNDIAVYKNYTFYANTVTKNRKTFSLLSVSGFISGTTNFTITDGTTTNTYTFYNGTEDAATLKVKYTASGLTPSQQVDECARSLVKIINKNASETVYAYYLSGEDDVPGEIFLESRTFGQASFSISSNLGAKFSPNITNSSTSDNEVKVNRLYYSKYQQPDSVPMLNYLDIGPKDKPIKRILALRDSLFILKEEGVYRLSGETAPFIIALFDNSTNINAPDTACVLNNQIYAMTRQGVVTISEAGIAIISRAIEDLLLPLPKLTNFDTYSFGIAYESARSYYLFTPQLESDTSSSQCFRYNTFTNTWTILNLEKTCGIVNSDDKIYLGASDVFYLEQERKDFSRTDYADREYTAQIVENQVNGKNIKIIISDLRLIDSGDVFLQKQYVTISQFNRLLKKLDLDSTVNFTNYYSTLQLVQGNNLKTQLLSLCYKLDIDTGVNDNNYYSTINAYLSANPDTSYHHQQAFNLITNKLNNDTGVSFINYDILSSFVTQEVTITDINLTSSIITIENSYPFLYGEVVILNHIKTEIEWAPNILGDATQSKQVRESTMLFEDTSFSEAVVAFSTDISGSLEEALFTGKGSGSFGNQTFGTGIFGGSGQSAPIRTFVPRNKQRCRYIVCNFKHARAREKYSVYGITFVFETVSPRAYRRI